MISSGAISAELGRLTRTLVLGGVAVIVHGLNRSTKDLDLWIDPNPTPEKWAEPIEAILKAHPELAASYLDDVHGRWEKVEPGIVAFAALNGRTLRLTGSDRPIDIFYQPNEVELSEFDAFWSRGTDLADGTRLMDAIDLIITKQDTNRPHDQEDINFLFSKVETELMKAIPKASFEFTKAQFDRFRSADTAFIAATNADERVQKLGISILQELAQGGDPFAQERLEQVPSLKKVEPSNAESTGPDVGGH
jgi:hypothetical protein